MPTKCDVDITLRNDYLYGPQTIQKIANFQKIQNTDELRTIVLDEFLLKGGLNKYLDEEEFQIFDFTYDKTGSYDGLFAELSKSLYADLSEVKPFIPDEDTETDDYLANSKLNVMFAKHMVYTSDDYKLHPEYDNKNTFNNIYHVGYFAILNGIVSSGSSTGGLRLRLAFKALISARKQSKEIPLLYDIALCVKYLKQLRVVKCPKQRCKIELYLLTLKSRILYRLKFPLITPLLAHTLQWRAFSSALPFIVNRMLWTLLWHHVQTFNFTWKIDYTHAREAIIDLVMKRLTTKEIKPVAKKI